jgi:hypothetical protein
VVLAIFHRLDHIDILNSVDNVCHSWRRVAREEASLWRRITVHEHEGFARRLRSAGSTPGTMASLCTSFCSENKKRPLLLDLVWMHVYPRFSLSEIKFYWTSWIKRINKIYQKYRTKFKKI